MRRIIFIVAFLIFSFPPHLPISVSPHQVFAKDPGVQKSDLPRAFLPKSETKITIHQTGESIFLLSNRLTLEEILERIAVEKKVILKFYCEDPSLKHERPVNLRVSGDSMLKVLGQLLSGDHRFTLLNREGKVIENEKDVFSVNISPKTCAVTDVPVRIFMAERAHPLLKKPPEEISLEELRDVIKSEGPAIRRRAAEILGKKADEKAIAYAKEALKDENPEVMFEAARVLKRLGQKYGSDKVADTIYARFREKPYAEFLPIIAEVDKDRIWPIAEGLMDRSGEKEKGIMVRALSLTKDRRAIEYLSRISTRSQEDMKQAIYAISKIGGPEAAAALMRLLREGDGQRQALAAQAVHFLPKDEGLEARAEVEKIVRKERVSDALIHALVEVSYLDPIEKLLRDPASKPDLKIRTLKAMAERGTEKSVVAMSTGLNDNDPQVRVASVEAMGSLAVEEAIPYLINATGDKDAKVRNAAIKGLSELPGDDRVIEAVGKAVDDTDQNVRRAAVDALRRLGKPSDAMIAILKACKNHKDPYVVDKAESILRDWGVPQ